ncbi:MAG: hypothetical protein GY708_14170 [Actinomycetia bacterium]|nr:hypothetical protein [Actinomycetes bacterium]
MSERRRHISPSRQIRLLIPLVVVWTIGGAAVAVAGIQTSVPRSELFLDATAISELSWYVGMLSDVGILAWTIASASALGGGWVAFQTRRPSAGRFLTSGGIVAAILLFDDLFRLHSSLIPQVLGVPKSVAMLLVVTPAILWLVGFAGEILRTRWLILLCALAAFVFSVFADQALPSGENSLLIEDGSKLLGVLAWSVYFVSTTHDIARSTIRAATRTDPITQFASQTRAAGQNAVSTPAGDR